MDRRIKKGMTLEEYLALPPNKTEERRLHYRHAELRRAQLRTSRVLAWQAAHTPLPDLEEGEE